MLFNGFRGVRLTKEKNLRHTCYAAWDIKAQPIKDVILYTCADLEGGCVLTPPLGK